MFKNFLKGMLVGVASILPGVSGGTMLVSMGLYDRLIHCVNHLFSRLRENIIFLLPIFAGAGAALVGLSFLIEPAFTHFPLQSNCLFIGLIAGGLPAIWERLRKLGGTRPVRPGYVVCFLVFFALVVLTPLVGDVGGRSVELTFSAVNCLKLFGVGIIASATMIIPGVSGSMLLLLLGYYTPLVEVINTFIKAALTLDIPTAWACCGVLVPMGLGLVFGVFAIARVVESVLDRFPAHAYWAVLGLVASSPIGILLSGDMGALTVVNVATSALLLAGGLLAAVKLGD